MNAVSAARTTESPLSSRVALQRLRNGVEARTPGLQIRLIGRPTVRAPCRTGGRVAGEVTPDEAKPWVPLKAFDAEGREEERRAAEAEAQLLEALAAALRRK